MINIRVASFIMALLLFAPLVQAQKTAEKKTKSWSQSLKKKLDEIEEQYPDQVGVYVKDLRTGEEFSLRGEEKWYIASGVKLPIALETLRQIDEKAFDLDTKIKLTEEDFVDGAGETNYKKPGDEVTVQYLIEQMLIHSDNTASDILIRKISLSAVNQIVQKLVPTGFSPITTLADVRRHIYSRFHLSAFSLKGRDFLSLKAARKEKEKRKLLLSLLKVKKAELQNMDLNRAYMSYYDEGLNSATLESYTNLLEATAKGHTLQPESTEFLLKTMSKVETGKKRIRAGLPKNLIFAHKTGTQYARVCDFGLAWDPEDGTQNAVAIAACTRGFKSLSRAERALKQVGQAIYESGVFEKLNREVAIKTR